MRWITACLLVLLWNTIFAQQSMPSAVLSLPDNHFDFGRIYEGQGKIAHTFTFTNSGNAPLVLTHVRSTCGCTTPYWTKEPVLPGHTGKITVEYDPEDRPGNFHKTIQIQSTASNTNMFVSVSGDVMATAEMEELIHSIGDLSVKSKHLNLGYIFRGDTAFKVMPVANKTENEIRIGFDEVPECLKIRANPAVLKPGEYGYIELTYFSEKANDWDVVIHRVPVIINGKKDKSARLPVTANIREDFRDIDAEDLLLAPIANFATTTVSYDTIGEKEPFSCRFSLTNSGSSDLIIRAIKPSCGCTAVTPEKNILKAGESTFIEAVFDPKGRRGHIRNSVTVITNDPKNYKQYLYIEGFVEP